VTSDGHSFRSCIRAVLLGTNKWVVLLPLFDGGSETTRFCKSHESVQQRRGERPGPTLEMPCGRFLRHSESISLDSFRSPLAGSQTGLL